MDFSGMLSQLSVAATLLKEMSVIFVIIIPVFVIVLIIAYLTQFKHNITIKKETVDGDIILYKSKFRFIQKTATNERIQIKKGFKNHPAPPEDFLQLQQTGRFDVTAYELNGGYLRYVKYKTDSNNENQKISETCPIDWDFYVTMGEKRKQRYSMPNIWSTINTIGPPLIMLIFVIALLAYWGDIQEPQIRREEIAAAREKVELEITQNQLQIIARLEKLLPVNSIPDDNTLNNPQGSNQAPN